MAVDIPISGNARGVVQAFRDIQNAIARARGEAADFAAIDMSHTELQGLGSEIKQVLKNFEDLVRVGRGSTAAGVRAAIGQSGITPASVVSGSDADKLKALNAFVDNIGRQYPDAADRARVTRNALNYITSGTSLQQPQGGDGDGGAVEDQPASALPSRKSGGFFKDTGRSGGSWLGSILGGEAGGAVGGRLGALAGGLLPELALPLLGIAGITGAGKMVAAGVQGASGEAQADDQLLRTLQESTDGFTSLRDAAREAAKGLMLTYQESASLTSTFAQLANISDPNAAASGMRSAVGFARGYGLDVGNTLSSFGSASLLGLDPERFASLIAEATAKGNDLSQTGMVMQTILGFAQNASRSLVSSGAVNGATGNFAAMFAAMQATGNPGFLGTNGAAILGQVNSAVMGGGAAGQAGQVATYQAFMRAGITDPYQVQYDLAGGAFGSITLPNGQQTDAYNLLQKNYFDRMQPGLVRDYAMASYYGINIRQAGALDAIKPADMDFATNYLSGIGINANDLNTGALPGIVGLINNPSSANAVKKQLLGNPNLSPDDARAINGASNPQALMAALVKGLNDTGLQQDEGTKLQQASIDVQNALTKAATGLLQPLIDVKSGLAAILAPLGTISTDLDRMLGRTGTFGPGNPLSTHPGLGMPADPTGGFGIHLAQVPNPGAPTRGLRNNNLLNLKWYDGSDGATGEDSKGFSEYSSITNGLAAAIRQIRIYQGEGYTTLGEIDAKWSPIQDNPNEPATLQNIENMTGLKADSSLSNPASLEAYLQAKAGAESRYLPSNQQIGSAMKITIAPLTLTVNHPDGSKTHHTLKTTVSPAQPKNPPSPPPSSPVQPYISPAVGG